MCGMSTRDRLITLEGSPSITRGGGVKDQANTCLG